MPQARWLGTICKPSLASSPFRGVRYASASVEGDRAQELIADVEAQIDRVRLVPMLAADGDPTTEVPS